MRKPECGRSIVEMLGVLAIMGVITVMGIAGYSQAVQKFNISSFQQQIMAIASGIKGLRLGATGQEISDTVRQLGYNLTDPFGNAFRVIRGSHPDYPNSPYAVFYLGPYDKSVCLLLANSIKDDSQTFGLQNICISQESGNCPDQNQKVGDAASLCRDGVVNYIYPFYIIGH